VEQYTVAAAKMLFRAGAFRSFSIDRAPMVDGWVLSLFNDQGASFPVVDARTKQPRVFKSLDGAVSTGESIGFKVGRLRLG
jgi:hypothetical protein